jgi:hypothetical protein
MHGLHMLDDIALQELCNHTKAKLAEASVGGRAQHEYWSLVDRIENHKIYKKIFKLKEQEYFDSLSNKIFQDKTYREAFQLVKCNKIEWKQYRGIGAMLAKKELEKSGVKYQTDPKSATFNQFLEVNHDISDEAVPWMIAGSMFLYYLRQIERIHAMKTEIL